MKKSIVIYFIIFSTALFAQNERQGIELPDFVITGRQSVNIPTVTKSKPEFIPTLSQEFFTPTYTPEELPLMISSNTLTLLPLIKAETDHYRSYLKVQMGKYSFPVGELNINQTLENYILSAKVWGSNVKEYVPYSGYNTSGISMTNEFFMSTRSAFLPGTVFKISAEYSRDSYKFFGALDPAFARETNHGSGLVSISSKLNKWINYGGLVSGNVLSVSENDFREVFLNANAFFDFKWNNFNFGFNGNYQIQSLTNNLNSDDSYSFYSGEGYVKLIPTRELLFTAGISYSASGSNSQFTPFGSLEYKLTNNLSVALEYKPKVKFATVKDFLKKNLYYNFGTIDNVFEKYIGNIEGMIKYEYDKYMTIALSCGYSTIDNYFYYDDAANQGKYDLVVLPEAKILFSKLNFYYYTNIYGYFIGEVLVKNPKDQSDKIIPYEPQLSTTITYGYDFDFNLGFKARYGMMYNIYTDLNNIEKLTDYHDLSLAVSYELLSGLKLTVDFQNILNRSNFVWKQYQGKPFDILAGIEYRW
jgi:hypothetical protein